MNLPPHLVAADVRRLTSFAAHPEKIARLPRTRRRTRTRKIGSWPQFACISRCSLPMNLTPQVGADVRRPALSLSKGLTSIFDCRFSNAECRMSWVQGHKARPILKNFPIYEHEQPCSLSHFSRRFVAA